MINMKSVRTVIGLTLEKYNSSICSVKGLSRYMGQDRNCHRNSCLLNCWSFIW